ncbi:MAG: glycerophosphodiester phosphodiesterase family protein [Paenibacillaceae bacterium]
MIRTAIYGVLVFILITTFNTSSTVDALRTLDMITAHRGSSSAAPENTKSSILRAIEDGAGFAEIDVQMSADGVVVVYHDPTLKKLGNPSAIDKLDYTEIINSDAGQWFDNVFTGERVPRLEEIIEIANNHIKLNIELKMYNPDSQLPDAVVGIIESNGFVHSCIVTSFDQNAIERIKQLNPNIKTGLIVKSRKQINLTFLNSDINIISVKSSAVNSKLMKKSAQYNKEVHVWTVNDEKEMSRMIQAGVTSIITDYPEKLIQLMMLNK